MMAALRAIYVRYLRGTALGNAARAVYHAVPRDIRSDASGRSRAVARAAAHLLRQRLYPLHLFRHRAAYVARYLGGRSRLGAAWLFRSRESSNFTYDLTPRNEAHMAEALAIVTGQPAAGLARYIAEIHDDQQLKRTVSARAEALGRHSGIDATARFGRRVGWYALARALKPRVVIETGVEKGLGAVLLCAALIRNAQEGSPGRYFGTDIDRGAGALWGAPYDSVGTILYGDSIESLMALDQSVDLFINDSNHSADYEAREYRVIAPKLSAQAVVIGDNAHVTDELLRFSHETDRSFLFFCEEPRGHWYPGAGIGLSFKRPTT
jgi:hypothetical protein